MIWDPEVHQDILGAPQSAPATSASSNSGLNPSSTKITMDQVATRSANYRRLRQPAGHPTCNNQATYPPHRTAVRRRTPCPIGFPLWGNAGLPGKTQISHTRFHETCTPGKTHVSPMTLTHHGPPLVGMTQPWTIRLT